jgi:hypothetical protein
VQTLLPSPNLGSEIGISCVEERQDPLFAVQGGAEVLVVVVEGVALHTAQQLEAAASFQT